jgi:hypothetical protein
LTVEESGAALEMPAAAGDVEGFWTAALERLRRLVGQIEGRRGKPRQAIIVIHGMGEQEPGVTLRKFVAGVFRSGAEAAQRWIKPDRSMRFFDLRQVTLKATERQRRPTTDVFELYWAHMIRDTTLSQVASWLRHLLFRRGVPRRFLLPWLALWGALLAVVGFAVAKILGYPLPEWSLAVLSGSAVAALATVAWKVLGKSMVLDSIGDAARYLAPRPANIEHRQSIREAGVDLLKNLHARGIYDRIVIVGHSLGSVIAYDILTQYWIQSHRQHLNLRKISNTGVTAVEKALDETDPVTAQGHQHDAWKSLRRNSQPWLITDLITAGSPLSAARFLMASEFDRGKGDRELPTCPPVEERKGGKRRLSFSNGYDDRFGGRDRTLLCLHHAAPFAVTRWTNLHFSSSLLGDPIGGPVAPQFGPWVRDVALEAPKGRPFFLHTLYWGAKGNEAGIRKLVEALHLDAGEELLAEMKKHSPLMYLPDRP